MRQLLKSQLLDALRESLRDLESLKLVSAEEPDVALLKRLIRDKIVELENDGAPDYVYEMTG